MGQTKKGSVVLIWFYYTDVISDLAFSDPFDLDYLGPEKYHCCHKCKHTGVIYAQIKVYTLCRRVKRKRFG